jgi:NADPH2:quinone reductase
MRAVMISKPGGPEVLSLVDKPPPEPAGEEVRVRIRAAGLNRADLLQRRGLYPPPPGIDPTLPGLEYAGEIDAIGPRCRLRQVGEPVMGLIAGGAYAEYVTVQERETIVIPAGLSWTQAAAIPEAFLTAYRAVFLEGQLGRNDDCLIRAATSGVGIAAVQLVQAFGGQAIGTSRSAERLERLRDYGLAHAHVEGQGTLPRWTQEVTAGRGAEVVLDLLGGHLQENLQALAEEGRLIVVGMLSGHAQDQLNLGHLLMRRQSIRAMTMRSLPLERRIELAQTFMRRLAPLFMQGHLQPVVDRVFTLEQAVQAHQYMESGSHFGKVILQV